MSSVLDSLLEGAEARVEEAAWDEHLHPRGPHGRFIELTDAGIRSAALAYNADYPELHEGIRKGSPTVRVSVRSASRRGSAGWIASITPGVLLPEGGIAAAQDPVTAKLRPFDGRLSGVEHARRATKYLGLSGAQVPIEYAARGVA